MSAHCHLSVNKEITRTWPWWHQIDKMKKHHKSPSSLLKTTIHVIKKMKDEPRGSMSIPLLLWVHSTNGDLKVERNLPQRVPCACFPYHFRDAPLGWRDSSAVRRGPDLQRAVLGSQHPCRVQRQGIQCLLLTSAGTQTQMLISTYKHTHIRMVRNLKKMKKKYIFKLIFSLKPSSPPLRRLKPNDCLSLGTTDINKFLAFIVTRILIKSPHSFIKITVTAMVPEHSTGNSMV